ncbi:SDR family NAD(P)-dependent oxidoreductase [Kribbella shirazensis]|uniref:NAD(P)-dependent dehydrogenase (Short-subunit alcohol dehydrogenase family) n=1 Tax=Kribbella shirazensis TaxID=1105143 RepID=A0A7X5ZYW6_9ACTN|nr:SDR family NAD(P)-dependent oxidoreductase [Kribbella shirazensis]NIK55427.1 NAD(P)-dependent dehydrogenase (short-subunit alcohol dehydrogenase family) [Kribbella shirazensis]
MMQGRTALVTGSTGGIGWETARELADRGARVILVGRDPGRAAAAAERIRQRTRGTAEWIAADLTRQAGIREVAEKVAQRHQSLHVLVNNFGYAPPQRELTPDGIELTFAANVLAPFLLTQLLLPELRAGAGRVVNLTGGIPNGPIDVTNLQAEKRFLGWKFSQYNHCKTALMAMSYEFARTTDGITVNVAYPGHASTPGNRAMPMRAFPWAYRPIVPALRILGPVLLKDIAKASRSSVQLATSPELEGVTGKYFDTNATESAWPDSVLDERTRSAVWNLCTSTYAAGRSAQ